MLTVRSDVEDFVEALLSVDGRAAQRVFERARADAAPIDVLERLIMPAMEAVGDAWGQNAASLSQVYMSGRICLGLVESATPPGGALRDDRPRLAVAVFGDGHSLGKKLVLLSLRSGGYEVLDLGSQRTAEELVAACIEHDIDILMVSVLMLRSALGVADLKVALAEAGLDTKLVVGGAPFRFDAYLAHEVGADYSGYSASDVTRILAEIRSAQ
jgi:trimethylamine corrinoid protein